MAGGISLVLSLDDSAQRARTIACDFDGTIMRFADLGAGRELLTDGEPEPGVKRALERLREHGYRIVIDSSRAWSGYGLRRYEWVRAMRAWLVEHGIPYDDIHLDEGKPPAIAYVDDLAIPYNENWPDIVNLILYRNNGEAA